MRKVRFENLDGLRFIAFFSVFLAHTFYSENAEVISSNWYNRIRFVAHLGIFGVNFFFVLSGFLISFLLITEKNYSGKINIGKFYLRRIFRIWPLYYCVVGVGFVIVPQVQHIIGNKEYIEIAPLLPYLLFYNNFISDPPTSAVLGVLWSIAVEEQFYLFWPIFFSILPLKRLPYFFLFLILISIFIRMAFIGYGYQNTLSCMSDLAVGSLLAYFAFKRNGLIQWIINLSRRSIFIIYTLGIAIFFIRHIWSDIAFLYHNERLLFSVFFGFVILEQNYSLHSFLKLSELRIISKLGNYTYGLYMLHFVAVYSIAKFFTLFSYQDNLIKVLVLEPVLVLIFSVLLAYFSYHYFEIYFLRLKKKFATP